VAGALLATRGLVVGVAAMRAARLRLSDLTPHLMRGTLLSVLVAVEARVGMRAATGFGGSLLSLASASLVAILLTSSLVILWPTVLGDAAATMVARFAPRVGSYLRVGRTRP
jgi:hypothetical protein